MAQAMVWDILADAIRNRQALSGSYQNRQRVFSPLALGHKGTTPRVLVFQTVGSSRSRLPTRGDFRCLNVDRLTNVRPAPGGWREAAAGWHPQSCMDSVEVAIGGHDYVHLGPRGIATGFRVPPGRRRLDLSFGSGRKPASTLKRR